MTFKMLYLSVFMRNTLFVLCKTLPAYHFCFLKVKVRGKSTSVTFESRVFHEIELGIVPDKVHWYKTKVKNVANCGVCMIIVFWLDSLAAALSIGHPKRDVSVPEIRYSIHHLGTQMTKLDRGLSQWPNKSSLLLC